MSKERFVVLCQPVLGGLAVPYTSITQCCKEHGIHPGTVRNWMQKHVGEWWTNGSIVIYRAKVNADQNNRTGNISTLKPIKKGEKRRVRT